MFLKFADENFVVCFLVVKELRTNAIDCIAFYFRKKLFSSSSVFLICCLYAEWPELARKLTNILY